MKYNEGELVVIGTLQETNTAENLVDLSVQISRETDRSITIISGKTEIPYILAARGDKQLGELFFKESKKGERNIFTELSDKGIIIIDNPADSFSGSCSYKEGLERVSLSELNTRIISSLSYYAKKTGTTLVVIINTPTLKDDEGKEKPDLRYVNGYCNFINYCNQVYLWNKNSINSGLGLLVCGSSKSIEKNDTVNWLLRRDGEIFAMERDMIIDGEPSRKEQLKNIVWLFEHTLREETKSRVSAFIRKLCVTNGNPWDTDYIDASLGSKLKNIAQYKCDSAGYLGIYDYFDKVLFDFDEEFMHVSFGGEYFPRSGSRDLFFRISSEDFDWTKAIEVFKSKIKIAYANEHIMIDKDAGERNPKVATKDKEGGLQYFYG